MAQGLQVWDENGNCTLDMTDNTATIYGIANTNGRSGYVSDVRINENSFVIPIKTTYTPQNNIYYVYDEQYPFFSVSNGKINWEYQESQYGNVTVEFLYGGYL